jgi:hypothetical protein
MCSHAAMQPTRRRARVSSSVRVFLMLPLPSYTRLEVFSPTVSISPTRPELPARFCGDQYLQTRKHTLWSVFRNSTKLRWRQRERSGGASGMLSICIGDPYLRTRKHTVWSVFRNITIRRRRQRAQWWSKRNAEHLPATKTRGDISVILTGAI